MFVKKFSPQVSCCSLILMHKIRVIITCCIVDVGGGGGIGVFYCVVGGRFWGRKSNTNDQLSTKACALVCAYVGYKSKHVSCACVCVFSGLLYAEPH